MQFFWHKRPVLAILSLGAMLGGFSAAAQAATEQVLDRVNAVSPKAVLDMSFDDPAAETDFDVPVEIRTNRGFTSCQVTSNRGLFCLDQNAAGAPGRVVRNWDPVFATGEDVNPYFSCADKNLALDTSKNVESCTSITADDNGAVVIAGKRKGGYNLIKVARLADFDMESAPSKCADVVGSDGVSWAPLFDNPNLCYKVLLPRDRPVLVDITYTTLAFPGGGVCTGIIGLENKSALVFLRDPDADNATCPTDIQQTEIVGSRGWSPRLATGEVPQSTSTLKFDNGNSYVLTVSNLGVVRAKQTNATTTTGTFQVPLVRGSTPYTSLAALRNARGTSNQCNSVVPQKFAIRTSPKSGQLYVTDYNFCEASAFQPFSDAALGSTTETGLKIAQFPGRGDLVLSTVERDATTGVTTATYPPIEPTLAPGISINLKDCADADGCVLVAGSEGQEAATLKNVKLASRETGLTLFQIKRMPDCRWLGVNNPDYPQCALAGVVFPTGVGAAQQYLNITPLLPKEVTDQFPNGLTDMYISPEYRAQAPSFLFDAFFGVTQDGVIFQDMAELRLDVLALTGKEYVCSPVTSSKTYIPLSELLKWDVTVTVSEKGVKVVGGQPGNGNGDMLTNIGCGSSRTGTARWSAYPYNFEMNPQAYDHEHVNVPNAISPPEDYFVHLVVDLFYDLWDTQGLVCSVTTETPFLGAVGGAALGDYCSRLESTWRTAKTKLETCISTSNTPRDNNGLSNCNAFTSQMANYVAVLDSVPQCSAEVGAPECRDTFNRLGELETRARSIQYVFTDRLVPSTPPNGFAQPAYEGLNDDGLLPAPTPY